MGRILRNRSIIGLITAVAATGSLAFAAGPAPASYMLIDTEADTGTTCTYREKSYSRGSVLMLGNIKYVCANEPAKWMLAGD